MSTRVKERWMIVCWHEDGCMGVEHTNIRELHLAIVGGKGGEDKEESPSQTSFIAVGVHQ
jgi:hypothetical protein